MVDEETLKAPMDLWPMHDTTTPYSAQNTGDAIQDAEFSLDLSPSISQFPVNGDTERPYNPPRLLDHFFIYFHAAHPFLLPRYCYIQQHAHCSSRALDAVISYIGSFYSEIAPTEQLEVAVSNALLRETPPRDGFTVQALLLYCLALQAMSDQTMAIHILNEAITIALEIGMNRAEFAAENGRGESTMEESWRRTWWELYVVDGMVAGVNQAKSFRLFTQPADVALPCEEATFRQGVRKSQDCACIDDSDNLIANPGSGTTTSL